MSWIIVRAGFFRYLKDKDPMSAYSQHQKEAIRFPTKAKARQAMKWGACLHSSWPCRIVKLGMSKTAKENVTLSNWVLRLSQMPLDWTSKETQRKAKEYWNSLDTVPLPGTPTPETNG